MRIGRAIYAKSVRAKELVVREGEREGGRCPHIAAARPTVRLHGCWPCPSSSLAYHQPSATLLARPPTILTLLRSAWQGMPLIPQQKLPSFPPLSSPHTPQLLPHAARRSCLARSAVPTRLRPKTHTRRLLLYQGLLLGDRPEGRPEQIYCKAPRCAQAPFPHCHLRRPFLKPGLRLLCLFLDPG